jgi:hypothetical protein
MDALSPSLTYSLQSLLSIAFTNTISIFLNDPIFCHEADQLARQYDIVPSTGLKMLQTKNAEQKTTENIVLPTYTKIDGNNGIPEISVAATNLTERQKNVEVSQLNREKQEGNKSASDYDSFESRSSETNESPNSPVSTELNIFTVKRESSESSSSTSFKRQEASKPLQLSTQIEAKDTTNGEEEANPVDEENTLYASEKISTNVPNTYMGMNGNCRKEIPTERIPYDFPPAMIGRNVETRSRVQDILVYNPYHRVS